jgi:hypothetical protein
MPIRSPSILDEADILIMEALMVAYPSSNGGDRISLQATISILMRVVGRSLFLRLP